MKLSSREYKLMLRAGGFAGDAAARQMAIGTFWRDAGARLEKAGIEMSGEFNVIDAEKQREVFFLDTDARELYRECDLVFRMRRPLGSEGDWDATLKFRHGDRLLARAQGFRRRRGSEKGKFEEDVKAVPRNGPLGFWALFSRSVDAAFEAQEMPASIGECLAPFSRLSKDALPPADRQVGRVAGLTITEHVFEGGGVTLSDDVEAECALILWWKKETPSDPYAAEFSFRFDLDNGQVGKEAAHNAWLAMAVLCGSDWADPEGPTKTTLVYGAD